MKFLRQNSDRILAFLCILPSIAAVGIFIYAFIFWTGWSSLLSWNTILPLRSIGPIPGSLPLLPPDVPFTGLTNYTHLLASDLRFQQDIQNTIAFTVLFIAVSLSLGLLLAMLLDQKIRGAAFFRAIFIFPMSVSVISTGVMWHWILNPGTEQIGVIGANRILEVIGLGFLKSGWYTDPAIGIKAVVIAATWQMAGFMMAIYRVALRNIPEELREAARLDGATEWQAFRYVILPLLNPTTFSAVIILGHISLKIFDLITAMTGPGAGFSTDLPAYYMYDTVFRGNFFARGASIATLLLLLVSCLVIPYLIYHARTEAQR